MKILHYTLGFPPLRNGGLVQYSLDVANEQLSMKNDIVILYPGYKSLAYSKTRIKKENNLSKKNFEVYRIINPLPISFFGGFSVPKMFMDPLKKNIYIEFLASISPDIIHIHTFLGLHKEFLEAAFMLKIKIVYTTHDYNGLSPNPHFFLGEKDYSSNNTLDFWLNASEDSYSMWKIYLMQSILYKYLKYFTKILNLKRSINFSVREEIATRFDPKKKTEMHNLKEYYLEMFTFVNFFHFNSTISESVFKNNLGNTIKGNVINITNSKVNSINIPKTSKNLLTVSYVGPFEEIYKGFYEYLKLANKAEFRNDNTIEFLIWGDNKKGNFGNVINKGRFVTLEQIYSLTDILIVPSLWKETFGLNVIEALSYNCKVLVSKNVGAKDILPKENIFNEILDINRNILCRSKNNKPSDIKTIKNHSFELIEVYQKLVRE